MRVRFVPASDDDRQFIARALDDASFRASYAQSGVEGMRGGTAAITANPFVRQPLPGVTVTPRVVGGVNCEVLVPAKQQGRGTIVYLHGGGYVRGSLELGRANASVLAARSGRSVVAIGYRQAPEHRFPAAVDDVSAAYRALLQDGHAAAEVVVAGESAGGALALDLAILHANEPQALPAGIAALSPMVDLDFGGASWLYNGAKDVANLAMGRQLAGLYLGDADPANPLASPRRHHFRGCCPLLIGIGTRETMLSDTESLVRKADDAGVDVRLDVYEDMPHGFTRFGAPISTQALADTASWCAAILVGKGGQANS